MKFHVAICELCRKVITDQDQVQAYECKDGTIEFIGLDGRQPYMGVNCLCNNCVYVIRETFSV